MCPRILIQPFSTALKKNDASCSETTLIFEFIFHFCSLGAWINCIFDASMLAGTRSKSLPRSLRCLENACRSVSMLKFSAELGESDVGDIMLMT